MAFEDIEIRIAKDGRVYVRLHGVSEDRIRNVRRFLEEEIGPVHSMEIIQDPDWDRPAAHIADEQARNEIEVDRNS